MTTTRGIPLVKNPNDVTVTTADFGDDLLMTQRLKSNCVDIDKLHILGSSENKIDEKLYVAITQWMQPMKGRISPNQIGFIQVPDRFEMFLRHMRESSTEDSQPNRRYKRLDKLSDRVKHPYNVTIVRGWFRCSWERTLYIKANGFGVIKQRYNDQLSPGFHFSASALSTKRISPSDECLIMCYILLRDPSIVTIMTRDTNGSERQYCFCADEKSADEYRHCIEKSPPLEQSDSYSVEEMERELYDEFFTTDPHDILPVAVVRTKTSFNRYNPNEQLRRDLDGKSGDKSTKKSARVVLLPHFDD